MWIDIPPLNSQAKERLGYPTQKPEDLLERIIQASSNEGDVVLDPFCGCGTAVAAAQGLKRQWIGIDVTHLAVALMKNRLKTGFGLTPGKDYDVVGEPVDVGGARALAEQDRHQFQYWAMSLLEAFPREQGKKGDDKAIEEVITRLARQHRESIEVFRQKDRAELADKEEAELALLLAYLPEQLTAEQVRALAEEAAAAVGASGPGDKGKVMGQLMPQVKGRAEGKLVNQTVTELLASL